MLRRDSGRLDDDWKCSPSDLIRATELAYFNPRGQTLQSTHYHNARRDPIILVVLRRHVKRFKRLERSEAMEHLERLDHAR
jgi:hypothetical protein